MISFAIEVNWIKLNNVNYIRLMLEAKFGDDT